MQKSPISHELLTLAAKVFEDGGTYLEAGAHDGLFFTNTLELEKQGWQGILVEPSPKAFVLLQRNRPGNHLFNVALAATDEQSTLTGTFLSGSPVATAIPALFHADISPPRHKVAAWWRALNWHIFRRRRLPKTIDVPARTLGSILRELELETLELLILDVEGYEYEALNGLGSVRPDIIVVETRPHNAVQISTLLCSWDYVLFDCLSRFNLLNNPTWDGSHQDFLWCRRSVMRSMI